MRARAIAQWAVVAVALGGCTANPFVPSDSNSPKGPAGQSATEHAPKPAAPPAAESPAAESPAVESPPSSSGEPAALPAPNETPENRDPFNDRTGFATRYAYFHPARWSDLPGWREDSVADALVAFRRSCTALRRKEPWRELCALANGFDSASDDGVRRFFESEFVLYEIQSSDRASDGVITGYYEPLIRGHRKKSGAFIYPVYAKPADLLTLDVRRVPRHLRGTPLPARIRGRTVVPVLDGNAPYMIDIGDLQSDIRDKKLRVRLEGKRIVPYPTRARIEREGLPRARVLAWLDNPAALYSMQIQGSGKVLLPNGRTVRLAYAAQNGHPFRPPRSKRTRGAKGAHIVTRGLHIELPEGNDGIGGETGLPEGDRLTRGAGSGSRQVLRGAEPLSADVEQLIEALATGKVVGAPPASDQRRSRAKAAAGNDDARAKRPSPAAPVSSNAADEPRLGNKQRENAPVRPMKFPKPSAAMRVAIATDPSYVFFREIPNGPEGPIGALGVPLTAGRSVAVDPRTTPLGFPVFVSTTKRGGSEPLNRLVLAQDTGGAIRGAVRADYFWGFGAEAYARASRMKEQGRMWLLLPRELQIAARDQALRTRGGGAGSDVECVVADPELCVEDP